MTGLKSGPGDDLWADEGDESGGTPDDGTTAGDGTGEGAGSEAASAAPRPDAGESTSEDRQPYIVRRALNDGSAQFERDNRLTSFVHDDVANGERDLIAEVERELGRNVPKFDLREAVYRAALRNREDVLAELLAMGYSLDEE